MEVGVSPSTALPAPSPEPRAAGARAGPLFPGKVMRPSSLWGERPVEVLPACPQATCRPELLPHSPAPPHEPRGRWC